MSFDQAIHLEAGNPSIEDRVMVRPHRSGLLIAVADGAGGSGNGAHAAESVLRHLSAHLDSETSTDDDWADFLVDLDATMSRDPVYGESTAIILHLTATKIVGASVGDSEAWFLPDGGEWVDLTQDQRRKPLLGDGGARPVEFTQAHAGGVLVAGTDGLFKYAKPGAIRAIIEAGGPSGIDVRKLVDSARLTNGKLQDDIGVVVCRVRI